MKRVLTISLGMVSTAFAGSLVAHGLSSAGMRLIAPNEAAWFQRQSPALKRKIIADLRSARACVSDYARRNGHKDAMTAAGLPTPRFYTGISNGVVVYRTVPAVKGCSPPFTSRGEGQFFRELPEAYSGPPRTMNLQMLCGQAASQYAATFNRTLARMKPDAFHAACPTGQLE